MGGGPLAGGVANAGFIHQLFPKDEKITVISEQYLACDEQHGVSSGREQCPHGKGRERAVMGWNKAGRLRLSSPPTANVSATFGPVLIIP